jgi:hypothetical protein
MTPEGERRRPEDGYHGWGYWAALVVGALFLAYGMRDFLDAYPDGARRLDLARWLVGSALVHDVLLVPAVLIVGLIIARVVPPVARAPVQFGAIASGVIVLVAWHPLHGSARSRGNPTVQPLDYRTATLSAMAVVWVIVLIWGMARARRGRSPGGRPQVDETPSPPGTGGLA